VTRNSGGSSTLGRSNAGAAGVIAGSPLRPGTAPRNSLPNLSSAGSTPNLFAGVKSGPVAATSAPVIPPKPAQQTPSTAQKFLSFITGKKTSSSASTTAAASNKTPLAADDTNNHKNKNHAPVTTTTAAAKISNIGSQTLPLQRGPQNGNASGATSDDNNLHPSVIAAVTGTNGTQSVGRRMRPKIDAPVTRTQYNSLGNANSSSNSNSNSAAAAPAKTDS
jgi:hypothetical protein